MVFGIHAHESTTGAHVSPHPEHPPRPSPPHSSRLSWSTGFECPASCIKLALDPSLFSLTLSLVEKEQRLLVLQEADSVQPQELSSLRQDMQEAQAGQKELSAQVSPTPAGNLFPDGSQPLESAGACSVTLGPQQTRREREARTGSGGAWEPDPESRTDR